MPKMPISRRELLGTLASVSMWSGAAASSGRTIDTADADAFDAAARDTTIQNAGAASKAPLREPPGRCGPLAGPLFADSPSSELLNVPSLYDGLIGSWEIEVIDYAADGTKRAQTGEWHFGWVLEGRAVQDVLIVPRRKDRFNGMPRQSNRYGTTLRFFDPTRKFWRIVWINPVNGALNTLDARKEDDRIVHEGDLAPGIRLRWTFADLTRHSFHWIGEFTTDGGTTWTLQAEFFARRAD